MLKVFHIMHKETFDFVARHTSGKFFENVLEIGGLDVNGSVRDIIVADNWHTIDIQPGPGVDEVANAATWRPPKIYDLVLCLEVFEHTPEWPQILRTIGAASDAQTTVLITAACDPRPAHGAYGHHTPLPGEYYANVVPEDLDFYVDSIWGQPYELTELPRGDVRVFIPGGRELVEMRWERDNWEED